MSTSNELRAALAVAELEEQLVDAKATEEGPSIELKLALREARQTYRDLRDQHPVNEGEARPETVAVTGEVN